MDERLALSGHYQLRNLRAEDLPTLAWAITAFFWKRARVENLSWGSLRFVRLTTLSGEINVLREEWLKLAPYLDDFNPQVNPVGSPFDFGSRDVGLLDTSHRQAYDRVLGVLVQIFPGT